MSLVVAPLSGEVVYSDAAACSLFECDGSYFKATSFCNLFSLPYQALCRLDRELLLSLAVEVKKPDETTCPVEVGMREIVCKGSAFVIVELKKFALSRVTFVVSSDGRIVEGSNVAALGLEADGIVGKHISDLSLGDDVLCLSSGSVTEHVFQSNDNGPVLAMLKVTALGAATGLDFETVNPKLLQFVALMDKDGTVRDCDALASRILTGYAREELLGHNINCIVPSLFPVALIGAKFGCQAIHKDGHSFYVSLILHELASGQFVCQIQRHLTDASYFAKQNALNVEIPKVTLGAFLGVGSFSVVRLGKLQGSSTISAVKIVSKKDAAGVQCELETLKGLNHHSIPKLHFVLTTPECFAIGMEFCPGIELGHFLMSKGSVLITEDEAKHYFVQLASAVAYIHGESVIHKDIKMENVIIQSCETLCWKSNRLKLIDFGFSCRFQPGVMQNKFCGTVAYASPEILSMTPYQGPEADVWAMGVVLYAMLRAKFPFTSVQEARCVAVDVASIQNPFAAHLVSQLLTRDAAHRITTHQVLRHQWLVGSDEAAFVDSSEILDSRDSPLKPKKRQLSDSSGSTDDLRLLKQPCKM